MAKDDPKHTEVVACCGVMGVALAAIGAALHSLALMFVGAVLCAIGAALS